MAVEAAAAMEEHDAGAQQLAARSPAVELVAGGKSGTGVPPAAVWAMAPALRCGPKPRWNILSALSMGRMG